MYNGILVFPVPEEATVVSFASGLAVVEDVGAYAMKTGSDQDLAGSGRTDPGGREK